MAKCKWRIDEDYLIHNRYPDDGGYDYFDAVGGIEGIEDSFVTPLAERPEGVFICRLM